MYILDFLYFENEQDKAVFVIYLKNLHSSVYNVWYILILWQFCWLVDLHSCTVSWRHNVPLHVFHHLIVPLCFLTLLRFQESYFCVMLKGKAV